MIDFQIDKVKAARELVATSKIHSDRAIVALCDVVLELLAKEKERETDLQISRISER